MKCVEEGDVSTAKNRAASFENCAKESKYVSLGCGVDCAPTFAMLAAGEAPTNYAFDKFGAGEETAGPRPNTSKCVAEEL